MDHFPYQRSEDDLRTVLAISCAVLWEKPFSQRASWITSRYEGSGPGHLDDTFLTEVDGEESTTEKFPLGYPLEDSADIFDAWVEKDQFQGREGYRGQGNLSRLYLTKYANSKPTLLGEAKLLSSRSLYQCLFFYETVERGEMTFWRLRNIQTLLLQILQLVTFSWPFFTS